MIEPEGPICEAAPMVLSTPYPARLFQEQKISFSFWQTLSTSLRASARSKKLIFFPETLLHYRGQITDTRSQKKNVKRKKYNV
ncbi:MAG: hypothetical protein BWY43_00022 [candidate division WS2 bacterium ADurb.Bin280]|uniref:Uncharacterized protein n=1 Tax=candidate division WS2 bacterium ADurb.Bin280 TaxID=1852829 RepID=A0A1V5SHB5_9BACT|nr:MAG: hypothetical protein BWY43_00022 [candidate division WS2 bacterium ADurb.Bin280]